MSARPLTSKGPKAEEGRYKADLLMILNYDLPDYKNVKGVLVQSKRRPSLEDFQPAETRDLKEQVSEMSTFSSSTSVFIYSKNGLVTCPSETVLGAKHFRPSTIPMFSIDAFFYGFAVCWIGDHNIRASDTESLRKALEAYRASKGLLVSVGTDDADTDYGEDTPPDSRSARQPPRKTRRGKSGGEDWI